MQLRKYRWSRHYESAEEELQSFLAAKNLDAVRWTAEAGDEFATQRVDHHRLLFCAEGSLSLTADGKAFSLQPGDALELPAGTDHHATAGLAGVVCYEVRVQP
jgi:quercetin dioxygenase-like cupin family protein